MQEYNAARQRRQDLSMFGVLYCNFKVVLRGLRDLSTAETKGVRGLLWERGGARAVPWVVNCKVLFWLLLISHLHWFCCTMCRARGAPLRAYLGPRELQPPHHAHPREMSLDVYDLVRVYAPSELETREAGLPWRLARNP